MAPKKENWEVKLEEKIKELENTVEDLTRKIDEKGSEISEHIQNKARKAQKENSSGHYLFWGVIFIIVGFLWLGNNLRWFIREVPWVPVVIIALGIYLIIRNLEKEDDRGKDRMKGKK